LRQDPLHALKIVGGTVYATYREAAEAMCIVPEAKEAELAMAEAVANKATPENTSFHSSPSSPYTTSSL
jgi:hypothetical protein